jgi:hypothetical protein
VISSEPRNWPQNAYAARWRIGDGSAEARGAAERSTGRFACLVNGNHLFVLSADSLATVCSVRFHANISKLYESN